MNTQSYLRDGYYIHTYIPDSTNYKSTASGANNDDNYCADESDDEEDDHQGKLVEEPPMEEVLGESLPSDASLVGPASSPASDKVDVRRNMEERGWKATC